MYLHSYAPESPNRPILRRANGKSIDAFPGSARTRQPFERPPHTENPPRTPSATHQFHYSRGVTVGNVAVSCVGLDRMLDENVWDFLKLAKCNGFHVFRTAAGTPRTAVTCNRRYGI